MNLTIDENGCIDKEISLLDTRLPYFYQKIKSLFPKEPENVEIKLLSDKQAFCKAKGVIGVDCEEGAFIKGETIFIYEPSLFGMATPISREDFYKVLYQELIHLFYQVNKLPQTS